MIKARVSSRSKVILTFGKGDYNLLRMVLEDTAKSSTDANIRDYLKDVLLPVLPETITR